MKKFLAVFILASVVFAQDIKNFPAITLSDIPGGKIEREEIFDGNSLWGHINGGADVYLEYGFDQLLFQDVKWNGNSFRVEFYKMIDAETAFGIFSISTHKCSRTDTLTKWICITPFQVQAAVGRYYISIANEKGTRDVENQTVALLEKILVKQKEMLFELPDSFAKKIDPKRYNDVKFIKGDLGFQNGFPMWQDMFTGFKNYTVFLLQQEDGKSYSYLAKINFASAEEATSFTKSIGFTIDDSQKYYSIKKEKLMKEIRIISDKEFYYSETNQEKPVIEKF